jgi:ArpU family phage transcriptional regulator
MGEQHEFDFKLPRMSDLDGKKTQEAVEAALDKYRIAKYLTFEEREASTTAGYSDMPRGNTNVTTDQTASIAIHNVDEPARRRAYCERMERAVRGLLRKERRLITERYLSDEYDSDFQYYELSDNRMSSMTFAKIREKAFYMLALKLDIAVEKTKEEGGYGK